MNTIVNQEFEIDKQKAPSMATLVADLFRHAVSNGSNVDRLRRHSLELLAEFFASKYIVWNWGYGDVESQSATPVAMIDFGLSDEDRNSFIYFGLDPATDEEYRQPIFQLLHESTACARRHDVFDDAAWLQCRVRPLVLSTGGEEWMTNVCFQPGGLWSSLFLCRSIGEPAFSVRDKEHLQFLFSAISWLKADESFELPTSGPEDLTARQRMVMMKLLDGIPRKAIAAHMGIHEDTVGGHVKAIFRHFNVRSVTELAAKFLKRR
jgi:DNA-binding CsgD family transcriptional regulator